MTRGERLLLFRRTLKLSQDSLARLSGFGRPEISGVERDKSQWHSDRLWQGLSRALGLTRQELEDYLDERMSIEQAVGVSRAHVEAMVVRDHLLKRRHATARRLASEAVELAGLSTDELAGVLTTFLEHVARRRDVEASALAEIAKAVHGEFAKWIDVLP